MSRPATNARPRRRRRPFLIALAVLLALLLAALVTVGLYVGGIARSLDSNVQRFDEGVFPEESLRPAAVDDGDALNFLLVGEDAGSPDRQDEGRSDSLMWVHVPADRKDVQIMSIMRDMYVDIPGHGKDKVNAAYQYGRIPLTVATVENLMGARVDHVVAVDLAGFEGLVDAVGGVTVDNPVAFSRTDDESIAFPAGPVHLDGFHALHYVRERYAFADSDFTRVENQRRVVEAIIDKLLSADTLANPGRVQDSVDRFAPYLTFDDDLDSGELASLGWSLRDVRGANIESFTVPTDGVGYTEDGKDVVWPDEAAIAELGEAIRTDRMDEFQADRQP